MHGRQRAEYKARLQDPKVAAGLAAKAQKWHALSADIAVRKQQLQASSPHQEFSHTSLAVTEKMLLVNPDPLYLWNFRRELLLLKQQGQQHESNDDDDVLESELRLTASALQNNPKSYGAWFHRKWVLQWEYSNNNTTTTTSRHCNDSLAAVWQQELVLTSEFLKLDERNFHCWSFRRFIVSCLLRDCASDDNDEWWTSPQVVAAFGEVPTSSSVRHNKDDDDDDCDTELRDTVLQTEWEFTARKIQDNFSNFSAFHYRSKLLKWKLMTSAANNTSPQDLLTAEWDLWQNAIFTEPDDQTAWWYGRFLLDVMMTTTTQQDEGDSSWTQELLEHQILQVRELAQVTPDSKWVCLGLHMLLSSSSTSNDEHDDECRELLQRLLELDPDRKGRYLHMLKKHEGQQQK